MRYLLPAVRLLLLAIFLSAPTINAWANGWEHSAVPFETLVKAMQKGQPETRARAAQSLGIRGQTEALTALMAQLDLPEKNEQVRAAIYGALGRLGDKAALPAIFSCLEEEPATLQGYCIEAVGAIGDATALPYLLVAASDGGAPLAQVKAVEALGRLHDPTAELALTRLLEGAKNSGLKLRAALALGESGGPSAVMALLDALGRATTPEMQLAIVRGLANHPTPEAAQPLTALLAKVEDPRFRFEIIRALGAIQDGDVEKSLEALVFDEAPAVSYAALRSLREQGNPAAAEVIRTRALETAEWLGERDNTELLADLHRSLVWLSLQVEALRALSELDPVAGLPAFLAAVGPRSIPVTSPDAAKLAEGFYEQQRIALFGLGYSLSEAALAPLQGPAGLGATDPRLRATAVRALGVLGFPQSVDLLLPYIEDENSDVRRTAASVLGRLAGQGNAAALIGALKDPVVSVRKEAAISLGYLGDIGGLAALEEAAAEDKNASVRAAAADSVKLLAP